MMLNEVYFNDGHFEILDDEELLEPNGNFLKEKYKGKIKFIVRKTDNVRYCYSGQELRSIAKTIGKQKGWK